MYKKKNEKNEKNKELDDEQLDKIVGGIDRIDMNELEKKCLGTTKRI